MQEPTDTHQEEIEEGRIIHNLHLLEVRILGKKSDLSDTEQRELNTAIRLRGTMMEPNGDLLEALSIEYATASGEIGPKDSYEYGERSRFNSWVLRRGGEQDKPEILLYQPGDMPTPAQYNEIMTAMSEGRKAKGVSPNRWILPERVIPGHSDIQGPHEVWGQSSEPISAKGDIVLLKTLRQFNNKHAPPR